MSQDVTIADLGALLSAHPQALFLHNQSVLTRGAAALLRRAWLAPFAGYSGVHLAQAGGETKLFGQVQRYTGSPLAALVYLAPQAAIQPGRLTLIVEHFLKKLGTYGVQGLFAEVDEHSAASAALQQAGLSVQAHQRVWKLSRAPGVPLDALGWQPYLSRHALAVRLLHTALVPAQVQHLSCGSTQRQDSYVRFQQGQLAAFADVQRGPRGTWLQVLAAPTPAMPDWLTELVLRLRPRRNRPLYIAVRSYQDWLEPVLEGLDADPGPRQAVLLRRMVQPVKVKEVQKMAQAASMEATSSIRYPAHTQAPMDER